MSKLPVEIPGIQCTGGPFCVLFKQLWRAFGLLFEYLALLGGIILLGVLPWALMSAYLAPEGHPRNLEGWAWVVGSVIYFITKTLARGALAYALAHIQHDHEVRLSEAIRVALRLWVKLLVTRAIAGAFIVVGLALGVAPGLYLMVRYAFITEAVVLEGACPRTARTRSGQISRGKWVPILGIYLLAEGLGTLLTAPFIVLYLASGVTVALTSILIICISSVLSGMGPIAFFLLYWQARTDELGHLPAPPDKEASA